MSALPEPLQQLAVELARLPGIGPRSAARIALHVVRADANEVQSLATALVRARQRVALCRVCGSLTDTQPCALCADARRDASLLCVVEQPVDVLTLEKSGAFRGHYHVLGGVLSPVNGVGPEDLRMAELDERVRAGGVREVILALGTHVEGDATAHYLAKRLAGPGRRVTRLAHGLPAGSGLEYADEVTLAKALEGRRELAP